MRVLYVITQSSWGGAQVYVYALASDFNRKKGLEIIVAGGKESKGELAERLKGDGIRFIELNNLVRSINPIKDIMAVWELRKIIDAEKPDVIHLNSSKAGAVGSMAAKLSRHRAKVVYTVHGWVFNENLNPAIKLAYYWIEKLTGRLKDAFICISDQDRFAGIGRKIAPAEKITRIYNGVDFPGDYFLPTDAARKKLALEKISPDSIIIGCVANFYPTKGLNYLIDAIKILTGGDGPDIQVVIIGDGELRPQLERQITDDKLQDRIKLAGTVAAAGRYLKAFDIAVIPSVKEGVPYFLLEAMSAGLPVVASKVGGIPEIIIENETGLLASPKNAQDLADKILLLAEDQRLREKFGRSGSARAASGFNRSKMIKETMAVYEK